MSVSELIEILRAKIMCNEVTHEELSRIMDICECEIVNRMAAEVSYYGD